MLCGYHLNEFSNTLISVQPQVVYQSIKLMARLNPSGRAETVAPDLDTVLSVLENPVRRRIIQRLSEGPAYPLRLSKELELGQQLVTKHLKVMERAGIVATSFEPSPAGPTRKIYSVSQQVSMSLAFGSNLFSAKILFFGKSTRIYSESRFASGFLRRIETISGQGAGGTKLGRLADVIAEIDRKMELLERDRAALLDVRNTVMSEGSKAIEEMNVSNEEEKILHYILNEKDRTVEGISRSLNMREAFVSDALRRLRELVGLWQE